MGAAQGTLLGVPCARCAERVLYLVGGGRYAPFGHVVLRPHGRDRAPHAAPHPAAVPRRVRRPRRRRPAYRRRDGRYANLFPERFHCSGVALRGKATVGGRVLHARVLDYMRDIDLQDAAVVQVFMPTGRNAWMSLGYAGFIGTVTAMNERGLAIGEMGGRGEGHWDGMPMSLLLRDVMERAGTVEEALAILRAAPRTCEYYYVLSDRSGTIRAVECTPEKMTVLRPGQQHPLLPPRAGRHGVHFWRRSGEGFEPAHRGELMGGSTCRKLIDIIKRPVAMSSNLHDAIFAPETLDMWFADAGADTPACDEPYAHVNLRELIEFYKKSTKAQRALRVDAAK